MRDTILIVDDEELNRELLSQIFEGRYKILMAKDGKEAIETIDNNMDSIAVILLDLIMPVVSGYQVLQVLNARGIVSKIPVVLITANTNVQVAISCYTLGASDLINKPFVSQVVKKRIINTIEMYQNKETLEGLVKDKDDELIVQHERLEQFYDKLMDVVSNIVEFRDLESGEHVKRVKGLTKIMAQAYMNLYPEAGLTEEKINTIVRASAIHDLGKISIPDSILLKPGRLTDEERTIMQTHTTKGCEILKLLGDVQDEEQFDASYEICRHHHERYDGKGYPDGLKEDEIPLSAQLVSVVDVYDALVCERVYKKPFDKETAYNMIVNGDCGVFSPKLLKCLEISKEAMELFADTNK